VAGFGLLSSEAALHASGHLHGAVAVGFDRLDLGDAVRGGFDQGHRDRLAVGGEETAHTGLAADDANEYFFAVMVACLRSA
jgi:hypothetical protein